MWIFFSDDTETPLSLEPDRDPERLVLQLETNANLHGRVVAQSGINPFWTPPDQTYELEPEGRGRPAPEGEYTFWSWTIQLTPTDPHLQPLDATLWLEWSLDTERASLRIRVMGGPMIRIELPEDFRVRPYEDDDEEMAPIEMLPSAPEAPTPWHGTSEGARYLLTPRGIALIAPWRNPSCEYAVVYLHDPPAVHLLPHQEVYSGEPLEAQAARLLAPHPARTARTSFQRLLDEAED